MPTKLHAKLCRRPSWSLWRHGRSLACAGDNSQRIRRLKICSVVLRPALKPTCSSAMIFSACGFNLFSMIFSMTLLGWLMRLIVSDSSGTAANCLSWEVWGLRTGFTGLVILVSARYYCRLSWERWLHPLLGPVLLGCCRLQPTSLSSMIVLQPPLPCEGLGRSSSVCVWGQFSTNGSPLALWLYSSEQYSVNRFSICLSVRHFPERSWTVVAFPCFPVVKSFTSWYALLLLLFIFSSVSLHCYPIQFSFAFFVHLLMLSLTSLYFSDPLKKRRKEREIAHPKVAKRSRKKEKRKKKEKKKRTKNTKKLCLVRTMYFSECETDPFSMKTNRLSCFHSISNTVVVLCVSKRITTTATKKVY